MLYQTDITHPDRWQLYGAINYDFCKEVSSNDPDVKLEDIMDAADCIVICGTNGTTCFINHLNTMHDVTSYVNRLSTRYPPDNFSLMLTGGSEEKISQALHKELSEQLTIAGYLLNEPDIGGNSFRRISIEYGQVYVEKIDPRTRQVINSEFYEFQLPNNHAT